MLFRVSSITLSVALLSPQIACTSRPFDGEGSGGEGSGGIDPGSDGAMEDDGEDSSVPPGDDGSATGHGDSSPGETSGLDGGEASGADVGTSDDSGSTGFGSDGSTGTSEDSGDHGSVSECVVQACSGKVYQCGDCSDNDRDGRVDSADPDCWGPCDNNEAGWSGEIPGQNQAPCKMDCYFDGNSGAGNDACFWNHKCDPLEPQVGCAYQPETSLPGTTMTCGEAQQTQGDTCEQVCGPLTPNGCDCFGCCDVQVDGRTHTVYIGTGGEDGPGTCNLDNVANPELCHPCTQVVGCLNSCESEACEICIGQTEPPPGCDEAACADGVPSCDPSQPGDCGSGFACVTGCCYPVPQ